MTTILIIYHSQNGNTKMMAESVAKGAASVDNIVVNLKTAADTTLEDIRNCGGIVIGSPEYFGYMAGMIKDFFDRTYEFVKNNKKEFHRPYTVFISAGNDGRNALNQIERICLGFPFRKVYEPIISRGNITKGILNKCFDMGQTIAAGCDFGIY
ncbi:MAG: flavodoxin family protein [Desulfobacterium sp.]|nr:flavodoxin family protein [Desulfobacterium sp.]MBU3947007.1 NAD(P)H-dependent oxidoreductase [Pseudomonadota bacterium]MBU4009399.1 NAD(P)H-dependent oxidoreductase [Pseudomonadota bacterium]